MSKDYIMLVKADAKNNNNKFYEITLNDDDTVTARYGRVGVSGVTENKGMGKAIFDKLVKQKLSPRKGYKEVNVMLTNNSNTNSLLEIVKRDISGNNPILDSLLEKLTKINKYQLLQASGGAIDIVDGIVKTELGVPISIESIKKARSKLIDINGLLENNNLNDNFSELLNEYLTLVPQKVPHKRGWDKTFFKNHTTIIEQSSLLDQIESSIQNYKPEDIKNNVTNDITKDKMFNHSLKLVEDGMVYDTINKFYESNINRMHSSSHLKLKKVYEIDNLDSLERYRKIANKIKNEKQLWHGTRAFNVLSILKSGLIIPKSTGGYHITGRMFYDGIYFSDQSSKALNYAYGYWGSGSRENNCFMFLADVAMGNMYRPKAPFSHPIQKQFHSTFAEAGKSGVMNNEMIVYKLDQVNLKYLCEFDA
jgi:poly [ADP-ribose] polymerase 2/3/4